jgi:antitoxin component YwqK of YwqJK toxin-antitoxin module
MKSRIITAITLILFSCISFSAIAQIGFTDKNEATNQYKDSLKEGKWIEYANADMKPTTKDSAATYRLVIYSKDTATGMVRRYSAKDNILLGEVPYFGGKRNGMVKGYYPSGALKSETPFANDEINGIQKQYYENQKLQWAIPYSNGKIEGAAKEYYPNDSLQGIVPYTNNLTNGISKEYYDDGELKWETPYTMGLKNGVEKMYYKFSKETPNKKNLQNIQWQTPYSNDKIDGTQIFYDMQGNKTEFHFENGKRSR